MASVPRLTPSEGALNDGSAGSDGSDGSDGPAPLAADFAAVATLAAGSLWKTCSPDQSWVQYCRDGWDGNKWMDGNFLFWATIALSEPKCLLRPWQQARFG